MEYRMVGELRVSVVGLGCRRLAEPGTDPDHARRVVYAALDAGITLFDTADTYGEGASEEILGRALRGHRHEVVVATKVGMHRHAGVPAPGGAPGGEALLAPGTYTQDATPRYLIAATENSLRRLGTDYIDLLQLHYPDPATPFPETAEALARLVRQGKARAVGLCNFSAPDLEAWGDAQPGWPPECRPVTLQAPYSLVQREVEERVLNLASRYGLGLVAYAPLFLGYLARAPQPGEQEADPQRSLLSLPYVDRLARAVSLLRELGREIAYTPAQLALRWVLDRPGVAAALAGATRPDQVRENAGVPAPLPDPVRSALDELSAGLTPLPAAIIEETVLECHPAARGGYYLVVSSGLKVASSSPIQPGSPVKLDAWSGRVLAGTDG